MSKNSFSYGVLANIGSGAVPGWLPNHWFREGFGAGSAQGSKEVPGQVLIREVPVRFRATGKNVLKTIWLRTGGQGSGTVPLVNQ